MTAISLPVPAPGTVTATESPDVVRVELITDTPRWDELREAWNELFDASLNAPPLHFDWLRTWWDLYGSEYADQLQVIVISRGERLIGALPLYRPRAPGAIFDLGQLRFLSTGEGGHEETCAEYLDLLHAAGEGSLCNEVITHFMGKMSWDQIDLEHVAADSEASKLFDRATEGYSIRQANDSVCFRADLSAGHDAYLGKLSRSTREEARRLLRDADRHEIDFETADGSNAEAFFDQLIEAHQKRWLADGRPGCFASPRFTEFHRRLMRLWIPSGKAVLGRLMWRDQPLALQYALIAKPNCYFYVHGALRAKSPLRSPGTAIRLMMQKQLCERGITKFDALRATADSYKRSYATETVPMTRLRVVRPSLKLRLESVATLATRASRKTWRLVRGKQAKQ